MRSDVAGELRDGLLADIDDIVSTYQVPGAVVGVFAGDQEFIATSGVADVESGLPLNLEMAWPIRSVTKAFTVTLILMLVDEGAITLDDTIEQYAPDLPNADRITIRQLADMSSGLPEYTTEAFVEALTADFDRQFTPEELIAFAAMDPAQFEPGADRLYTNTNTVVLGTIVEQVTGKPFEEVLQERILDPLALSGTSYPMTNAEWPEPHATGYQPVEGVLEPAPNNFSGLGPAGALISTLDDLRTFAPQLANGTLIKPETQQARLVGGPLSNGHPEYDQYALGIGELDGWWGHTGEGLGFTVVTMGRPGTEDAIVILMNASSLDVHAPTKLVRSIAETLANN